MLTLIAAISENNVIGNNNNLIWRLPDDLKRFKKLTSGHPIIMGRKTFESFPNPLPNRTHFVISRQNHDSTEQVIWIDSLEKAIEKAQQLDPEVFIIGGGIIYEQALPLVNKLDLTFVHQTFEGDTFFPEINFSNWELIHEEFHQADEKHLFPFTFKTFQRRN